ncbi:alpha/beta hydrolase [Bariatricus sp. SGI.154]|uniref:alpha/beta hydrolase n=1 Tax=Bariatricus sp. SGI.154 TaxID=3420549 RepID=UPI003CFDA4BC
MVYTWDITIPELTDTETRRAYVYLPESYDYDPSKRYPVLYMFDGHNVFFDSHATYGKSWGMKEYMDYTETPLIIAAVECNHSPNNGRLEEYSPYSFRDSRFGKVIGRGRTTMEWLVHTFKKEIDKRFLTLPDREHTYIAGSSMGGLMSLYAVLEYNHIFSRAAALSPSLWVDTIKITRLIQHAKIRPDTVVYMDYGSREMNFHSNMRQQFEKVASLLLRRRVMLDCRIVPGGDHSEASWEKQISFFMHTLLYQY